MKTILIYDKTNRNTMKFENRIINPILKTIKKNQVYLTKPENLPQLAKLGYIYNTLWYGGRHAAYDGILDEYQCDDNPKYKIEMCEPENDVIENYIYDAWGMHVSNDFGPDWNTFNITVLKGKELTEIEIKLLKQNKTFDEWVEIMTDPEYKYPFKNRKSVADHLLCVIGNGYGYKNGFVFEEASGADQNVSDYGDWQNAIFKSDIQKVVDKIISDPEVEKVMVHYSKAKEKYEAEELAKELSSFGMPYKEWKKKNNDDSILTKILGIRKKKNKYQNYYPICDYSIITKLDANSDPSYIKAAIEICEEILQHETEESKNIENVKFANKFLKI